jgi:hypothetical protein
MDQRRLLPRTRQSLVSDGSMSNRMKRGLAGVMALGTLLLSTAAMAAPQRCADPDQQELFEVAALKTELMVVATTCDQEDNYNAFITRYRSSLSNNDNAVIRHFTGRDRRAGQKANDTFITNLANSRAQEANRVGSDFCNRNARLFKEVMGLNNAAELPAYAAAKDLIPVSMGACPLNATTVAAAPAARGGKAPARRAAR